MTGSTRPGPSGPRLAVGAGVAAGFVAAVQLVRFIRPGLLVDSDPAWAPERLVLGLALGLGIAAAGGSAAAVVLLASGSRLSAEPRGLPFSRGALLALTAAAILAGAILRTLALGKLPDWLWVDDTSLISPTLALEGRPRDFANSIRSVPYGRPDAPGTVGVLYLEFFRLCLTGLGATVAGVRLPSALFGVASLLTAAALGRALLPSGGGALAALFLAGLRWHLIESRWGWVALAVAPLGDVAMLLLLRSRRRGSIGSAAAAGLFAGACAHLYLVGWTVAAACLLFVIAPGEGRQSRWREAAVFIAVFSIAVAPLFLLRAGRERSYFVRTGIQNVYNDMRVSRSLWPLVETTADSFAAPWLLADPNGRHDLPGRPALGFTAAGLCAAVGLARAFFSPRRDDSAFLLAHAAAAFATSVAGGHRGLPNTFRFVYLAGVACVAAASGLLTLLAAVPVRQARRAALAALGIIAFGGALGARDALGVWARGRETFDAFAGAATLLGRAAARWDRLGAVRVETGARHPAVVVDAVRRYRLDPDEPLWRATLGEKKPRVAGRIFRVVDPGAEVGADERVVERVRDGWGREHGLVVGRLLATVSACDAGGGARENLLSHVEVGGADLLQAVLVPDAHRT